MQRPEVWLFCTRITKLLFSCSLQGSPQPIICLYLTLSSQTNQHNVQKSLLKRATVEGDNECYSGAFYTMTENQKVLSVHKRSVFVVPENVSSLEDDKRTGNMCSKVCSLGRASMFAPSQNSQRQLLAWLGMERFNDTAQAWFTRILRFFCLIEYWGDGCSRRSDVEVCVNKAGG